jgi:hypothetical protein
MNGRYWFLFITVYVPLLGEKNIHTKKTEALLIASEKNVLEISTEKIKIRWR